MEGRSGFRDPYLRLGEDHEILFLVADGEMQATVEGFLKSGV